MGAARYEQGETIVARLDYGSDLLAALAGLARAHDVLVGEFRAIGALQRGRLSSYDQLPEDPRARTYVRLDLDEPLEIVSLLGTVSRRDGEVAIHAHACLSDERCRCYGGHVETGCIVFSCEVALDRLRGSALDREYDEVTGLWLWRQLKGHDEAAAGR